MQGSYRYALDGRPVAIEETFSQVGERWTARRVTEAVTLGVEATIELDGTVSELRVAWDDGVRRQLQVTSGDRGRRWRISASDGTSSEQTVDQDAYLFPLLRCFQGAAILAIHAAGPDGCRVVVPDITDPGAPQQLLHPRFDSRRAARTDDGAYLYVGGSYDSGASCSVGTDGLLESYTWDQPGVGRWLVTLERDGGHRVGAKESGPQS